MGGVTLKIPGVGGVFKIIKIVDDDENPFNNSQAKVNNNCLNPTKELGCNTKLLKNVWGEVSAGLKLRLASVSDKESWIGNAGLSTLQITLPGVVTVTVFTNFNLDTVVTPVSMEFL